MEIMKLWLCKLFLADITRLSLVQSQLCFRGLHLSRRDKKGNRLQKNKATRPTMFTGTKGTMWNTLSDSPTRPCAAGALLGSAPSAALSSARGAKSLLKIQIRTWTRAEQTRNQAEAGWPAPLQILQDCYWADPRWLWWGPRSSGISGAGWETASPWTVNLCPAQPWSRRPLLPQDLEPGQASEVLQSISRLCRGEWLSPYAGMLIWHDLRQKKRQYFKFSCYTAGVSKSNTRSAKKTWTKS